MDYTFDSLSVTKLQYFWWNKAHTVLQVNISVEVNSMISNDCKNGPTLCKWEEYFEFPSFNQINSLLRS